MNLSITEISGAVIWLVRDSVIMIAKNAIAMRIFSTLMIILIHIRAVWYMTMYIILLDRMFACVSPLKHMVQITTNRLKFSFIFIWAICLLSAAVFSSIAVRYFQMVFSRELFLALAGFFFLLSIITYTIIFYKIANSYTYARQGLFQSRSTQFAHVTGLIMVTFFIFEVIPNIVGFVNKGPLPSADFLHATALLTDPIVYILFKRDLKAASQGIRQISKNRYIRNNNVESGGNSTETRNQPSNITVNTVYSIEIEPESKVFSQLADHSCQVYRQPKIKQDRSRSSTLESSLSDVGILNPALEVEYIDSIQNTTLPSKSQQKNLSSFVCPANIETETVRIVSQVEPIDAHEYEREAKSVNHACKMYSTDHLEAETQVCYSNTELLQSSSKVAPNETDWNEVEDTKL